MDIPILEIEQFRNFQRFPEPSPPTWKKSMPFICAIDLYPLPPRGEMSPIQTCFETKTGDLRRENAWLKIRMAMAMAQNLDAKGITGLTIFNLSGWILGWKNDFEPRAMYMYMNMRWIIYSYNNIYIYIYVEIRYNVYIYICTYSTWNASNSRNWEARSS